MNLCMYVFMCGLHSTTQLFSMEEMQIHPGWSSQQLFVQKFLFFNSGVNGNTSFFFFQFLKYFWFDWAVEELECAWNKPLSGNGLEAQFCTLENQCWNTTLCSVLVNRLEWRAKSDLRKLHLLSGFKYFETSTPWDCFRIKWVMVQR